MPNPSRARVPAIPRRGIAPSSELLALVVALHLAACGGAGTTAREGSGQTGAETTHPVEGAVASDEDTNQPVGVDSSDGSTDEDDGADAEPDCVPVAASADEEDDPDHEPTPAEIAASDASDAMLRAFEDEETALAQRLARQMVTRYSASRETIAAHGVLARIAVGAEDFRRARPELEAIVAGSTEYQRTAVARFHLFDANVRLHRTAVAIQIAIDANRAAADACESNEFIDAYEVLLPSAFVETITDAPSSVAAVSSRLAEGRFAPEFVRTVHSRLARLLAERARWSQALAVTRASPVIEDDPSACDRIRAILALTQYGAGPLTADELAQVESCGEAIPTSITTPTRDLSNWVYEARDAIEACVREAREAAPSREPRLAIAAGRPRPRFARTGDPELDACLVEALEEVGDPGFDVANPEDFYEPPELDVLTERYGSGD